MSSDPIPLRGGEAVPEPSLSALLPVSPRQIGEERINAVDARRLHAFLGVGRDFSNWIKDRIDQFGFLVGLDFEVFAESGENPQGGRPAKEYALSLDMAKELSMVERTAKGKEARAYFLDCERKAHDPVHQLLSMSRTQMLELTLGIAKQRDALRETVVAQQATIDILEPKAAFTDAVAVADGCQDFASVAQVLGTGRSRFFGWLRIHKVLIEGTTRPFQCHIDAGRFRVVERVWTDDHGVGHPTTKTLVTGKGLIWLQQKWAETHAGGAAS